MKQFTSKFLLSWLALLFAFALGGAGTMRAQTSVTVGSQITSESGLVSGNAYLIRTNLSNTSYVVDNGGTFYSCPANAQNSATEAAVFYLYSTTEGGTTTWKIKSYHTGKYWGTPTASATSASTTNGFVPSLLSAAGDWTLSFDGSGNVTPSCNSLYLNRYSSTIVPHSSASTFKIYEVSGNLIERVSPENISGNSVYSLYNATTDGYYPIYNNSGTPGIATSTSQDPQMFYIKDTGNTTGDDGDATLYNLVKAEGDGNYLTYSSATNVTFSTTASTYTFLNENSSGYTWTTGTAPIATMVNLTGWNGTCYQVICDNSSTESTTFNGYNGHNAMAYNTLQNNAIAAKGSVYNTNWVLVEEPYTVYTLSITDPSGSSPTVTYTNASDVGITRSAQSDGGFFAISNDVTPTASMFTPSSVSGYASGVSVSGNTVTVTYVPIDEINLTFDRTGTNNASVTVNVKNGNGDIIPGVTATLESTSFTSLKTGSAAALSRTTNSVLAPDAGYDNKQGSTIEYTFKVEGLGTALRFNAADLDVYALTVGGAAQSNNGGTKRPFDFDISTGTTSAGVSTVFSSTGNDICTVSDQDDGLYHMAWSMYNLPSQTSTEPLYVKVTLTKTASEGCYAGIGSLRLYDELLYTVSFSGVPSGYTATATYGAQTGLTDGATFVASSGNVSSSDISATELFGYSYSVDVDNANHTVTVTYTAGNITLTFTDGTNAVNVSVNGGEAASTYSHTVGTTPSGIVYGGSNYTCYILNGNYYYGNNNPALLTAIASLTADATITVFYAAGSITLTDIDGNALVAGNKYLFKNATSNCYMQPAASDPYSISGTTSYLSSDNGTNHLFTVAGAGNLVALKSLSRNAFVKATEIADGADKLRADAATEAASLVLLGTAVNTTAGSASMTLTAANVGGTNYNVNPFGTADANLGFWYNNATGGSDWSFVPAVEVIFEDNAGSALSVNATIDETAISNSTFAIAKGTSWTALEVPAASVVAGGAFTLNGVVYTSVSDLLTALTALTADATVTYGTVAATVTFTQAVSVGGADASNTYASTSGTVPGSIVYSGSNFVTYTLGGKEYHGNNNAALLAAIGNLTSSATITVTPAATSDITLTDVNGAALTSTGKYFIQNAYNDRYMWVCDNGTNNDYIKPQDVRPWASNYRYSVEGTDNLIAIKSLFNNNYLIAPDISSGGLKVSATGNAANSALVFKGSAGTETNGFVLTPADYFRLNFNGGSLGFWENGSTADASNTWRFIPAVQVSFVDASGAAVSMTGTIDGSSFTRDNVCYRQGWAWTALAPAASTSNVVQYTLNGTTYDSRNMDALYTALNALTEDATLTVQYSGDFTVRDVNGDLLEEGKNYFIKLPGRGEYYFTRNGNYVKLDGIVHSYEQAHQVAGWGHYLAIKLPYRGSDYYLGVDFTDAAALDDGTDKVWATNNAAQILRLRAEAIEVANLDYTYNLQASSNSTTVTSTLLSNHSGIYSNMGFLQGWSGTDAGSYFQFIPATVVTFVNSNGDELTATIDETDYSGKVCRMNGETFSSLSIKNALVGDNPVATINGTQYTGYADILAAINALTEDATVTFNSAQLTFVNSASDELSVTLDGTSASSFTKYAGYTYTTLSVAGQALGTNSEATIGGTTYTGADEILAAINTQTADATVTIKSIVLSFVDFNGWPVEAKVNGKTYAAGQLTVIQGQSLQSLTPPSRFATYTIGETSGLNYQQVINKVPTLTANTTIQCSARYILTFADGSNGNTINSQIHSYSNSDPATSGTYSATHEIGMGCVLTKIDLDGYTDLNYTYTLKGENYDIIDLYAALGAMEVGHNEVVTVTVSDNSSDITVKDIYGNPLKENSYYYVKFPGRGEYYLAGSTASGSAGYELKVTTANNAGGGGFPENPTTAPYNRYAFQVTAAGRYLRLLPSFRSGIVGSEDRNPGADKLRVYENEDLAVTFRAEENTSYANCYVMRVAHGNSATALYLSNFGGIENKLGFYGSIDAGGYVQFVPYVSGLTLNFASTSTNPESNLVSVNLYTNASKNGTTAKATGVTSLTLSSASDVKNFDYYITDATTGAGYNIASYIYNGNTYTTWEELLSSGAAVDNGTVYAVLTTAGIQPLDINGNPVVAGASYRIIRVHGTTGLRQYLTWNSGSKFKAETTEKLSDGTQTWTVSTSDNFATMKLALNGKNVSFSGNIGSAGTAYVDGSTGTEVTFHAVKVVEIDSAYYFLETTLNSTAVRLANEGTNFGFYYSENVRGIFAKLAFEPIGANDAYGQPLTADRPYRIELPAKVGAANYPEGLPVTLTLTSTNSYVTETQAFPASIKNYNMYYWLPETYTGLNYMYNDKQAWWVEPVTGAESSYKLRSANGYVKATTSGVVVNESAENATAFELETATYDDLTQIYGLKTVLETTENDATVNKTFYLCCNGTSNLNVTETAPSASRWGNGYVFRFTPLKSSPISEVYAADGSMPVKAKGFDCYGLGYGAKGLVYNASTYTYSESATSILDARNMVTGLGDKNDSIVGYHLPETIYLAYDYGTNAYQETVDFSRPTLIGYKDAEGENASGTAWSSVNKWELNTTTGYYVGTGYQLKNFPIVPSAPPSKNAAGEYTFDSHANWYLIDMGAAYGEGNAWRCLIKYDLTARDTKGSLENPFVDKYLFCFVGDSINGYLIYNKAYGPGYFVGSTGDQADWGTAHNVVYISNDATTDAKRNKSRIVFQWTQHDNTNWCSFVDRYTGFSLDRWTSGNKDFVCYWHGRPTKQDGTYVTGSGNGYMKNDWMTTYNKRTVGAVANSFNRDGNTLMARTMMFPDASETLTSLLKDAMENGYLSSMVGYVGMFRTQEDLDAQYASFLSDIAAYTASTDEEYNTDTKLRAAIVRRYYAFFDWLKDINGAYAPKTNGVQHLDGNYYYIKSAANDGYLALTTGTEGADSYSITTTATPDLVPGAIWQLDKVAHVSDAYESLNGNTYRLRNVYWDATLAPMTVYHSDATSADSICYLTLNNENFATVEVYNDMTKMENPGQHVIRTSSGGHLKETDDCFTMNTDINKLIGHEGTIGGGQRRWYFIPKPIESKTNMYSSMTTGDLDNRVENYSAVWFDTEGTTGTYETFEEPYMLYHDDPTTDPEHYVYTTYYNPDRAVVYPHNNGITAFRADYFGEQKEMIHLVQLDNTTNNVIPAGMGVVLRSKNTVAPGNNIPMLPVSDDMMTNSEKAESSATNLFRYGYNDGEKRYEGWAFIYKKASGTGSQADPKKYQLYFYTVDPTKGYTFGYHKAYIPDENLPASVRTLSKVGFSLEALSGDVTSVDTPRDGIDAGASGRNGNDATYDVQGRRVTTPRQHGVYIQGGKKVYVK